VLTKHSVTIAPSTYYARRATPVSPAELEEVDLVNALMDLHQANWGVYGGPEAVTRGPPRRT
jgi:putative transposase